MTKFPQTGKAWHELDAAMTAMTAGDIDWRRGRAPLYTFFAGEQVERVGKDAFTKFMSENALGGRRAFFGLRRMEEEVLDMGLDLFHAPAGSSGIMTTGGTESILLAVKGCRDRVRATRGAAGPLNIVAPVSAHPAFEKAGGLMDIPVRRVKLGPDFRADPAEIAAAIDDGTMMIVGSAPCFSHGVVDPIRDLGALALERDLWLHVGVPCPTSTSACRACARSPRTSTSSASAPSPPPPCSSPTPRTPIGRPSTSTAGPTGASPPARWWAPAPPAGSPPHGRS